jgi:hypothetical protein
MVLCVVINSVSNSFGVVSSLHSAIHHFVSVLLIFIHQWEIQICWVNISVGISFCCKTNLLPSFPEDGGSRFLCNTNSHLGHYIVLSSTWPQSKFSPVLIAEIWNSLLYKPLILMSWFCFCLAVVFCFEFVEPKSSYYIILYIWQNHPVRNRQHTFPLINLNQCKFQTYSEWGEVENNAMLCHQLYGIELG